MYGFQVVDDEGRSKKLWCYSQQACQEWCHFLTHWANTEVLLSHWYHVQWSKLLGRYALNHPGGGWRQDIMCMPIAACSQSRRLHDLACNAMLSVQYITVHIGCLW